MNVSTNSYFGNPRQLSNAIQQNLNISMVFGAGNEDGYGGIHQALDSYEFRNYVKKRMVLFADDVSHFYLIYFIVHIFIIVTTNLLNI